MPPHATLDPFQNHLFHETTPCLLEQDTKSWSVARSAALYRVDCWGAPYFFVNAEGNMAVRPYGKDTKPGQELDIMRAVHKVVESNLFGEFGLPSPLILRFPDVLKDRLEKLQSAFDIGIRSQNYQGCFRGVFPVKCNQDRFVVDNVVEFGKPYGFGLEAGSKPELLLAMSSLCLGSPEALLICNGYKDADYVCIALLARQLGLNCVIVLEQEEELDLVLKISRQLGIEPVIGLRAKLNAKHAGHFGETSGENGKFGLSCSEIVAIVQKLRRSNMLASLQLLHFHIGSQIPSLAILNDGVSEAAYIYCELALMGANMKFIDIGGGLGIDYDGTNCANSDMSVGYSMEEYAEEVVRAVKNACLVKAVKQPTLCSESGRALVSHHSVLIFDVVSVQEKGGKLARDVGVSVEAVEGLSEEMKAVHKHMLFCTRGGDYEEALECAKQLKLHCIESFKQGRLSLMQLAKMNSLHEVVSTWVEEKKHEKVSPMASMNHNPQQDESMHDCSSNHSAIYHINLSIFKSMPDTWAIGQLFPILPLHRLQEEPKVRAILSDLTCDSDGKIATFVGTDSKGKRMNHLLVHPRQDGKPYYMAMFLGGAYQEALGGVHNLFGTPPVVHVLHTGISNGFKVIKSSDGQSIADVLRCMQHQPESMLENLNLRVHRSFMEGRFGEDEEAARAVSHTMACSLRSSTYLSTKPTVIMPGSVLLEHTYCCS